MPNYRRPKVTGATIFFTVCLDDRQSDRLVREVELLRDAVRRTCAERPFESLAWVVLPDHLHCIWRLPVADRDFSTRWSVIKARFSLSVPPEGCRPNIARRRRGLWQHRFWEHHIRDEQDLMAHVRYCWLNPVKHGLVADPADWPYSSIHRDLRLGNVDADITTRVTGEPP